MGRALGFFVLLLGVAALVGATLWVTSGESVEAVDAGAPPYQLPVTLGPVARGNVQPSVGLTGTVRTAQWAQLAFTVDGPLIAIEAREADSVTAGSVLARLDDTDQRLAVTRAQANLDVARRELDLLESGARGEVKRRLAAELAAAEAEEKLARLEVQRRQTLVATDDVSQAEMDRVLATQRAATARREAADERLGEAESGARAEDIAIAAARVAVAEASLEQARRELEKTTLRAPWDGSIVQRHRSVGDYLKAGELVLELADLAHLEIDVEVSSRYALRLGERPPVVIRVDEDPTFEFHTRLDAEVPAADRISRNFRAVIRVDVTDLPTDILRPGMFVRVVLLMAELTDVLTVPGDAVRITEEGPVVVVADDRDGTLVGRWTSVRLLGGDRSRTAIEPLGTPLAAGDRVVVTGVDLAYPDVTLLVRGDPADADSDVSAEDTP